MTVNVPESWLEAQAALEPDDCVTVRVVVTVTVCVRT